MLQLRYLELSRLLLPAVLLAVPSWAQFTTVTGTVQDTNGCVYQSGSGRAQLVPTNISPTINSSTFQQLVPIAALDSSGKFSITLADNTQVSPASTQWKFSFCNQGASTCFAGPTVTISGNSQDITSNIQTSAALLNCAQTPQITTLAGPGGNLCNTVGGITGNGTIQISGTITVAANCSVPSRITLVMLNGASFTINNGVTLTINGPLQAGPTQIFTYVGTGKVAFGNSPVQVKEGYGEWWGCTADATDAGAGTDNQACFQNAINALQNTGSDTYANWQTNGRTLQLLNGLYRIGSALAVTKNLTIQGVSRQSSEFIWTGGADYLLKMSTASSADREVVRSVGFTNTSSAAPQGFIQMLNSYITLRDILVLPNAGCTVACIDTSSANANDNIHFQEIEFTTTPGAAPSAFSARYMWVRNTPFDVYGWHITFDDGAAIGVQVGDSANNRNSAFHCVECSCASSTSAINNWNGVVCFLADQAQLLTVEKSSFQLGACTPTCHNNRVVTVNIAKKVVIDGNYIDMGTSMFALDWGNGFGLTAGTRNSVDFRNNWTHSVGVQAVGFPGIPFASLPAATNGALVWCNDCTATNPCAGSGSGATASRISGAWVCGDTLANIGTPAAGVVEFCTNCNVANPCTSGGGGAMLQRTGGANVCTTQNVPVMPTHLVVEDNFDDQSTPMVGAANLNAANIWDSYRHLGVTRNYANVTDGTVLFANLGTPVNGTHIYCTDCIPASTCVGSGNGAWAIRVNGTWACTTGMTVPQIICNNSTPVTVNANTTAEQNLMSCSFTAGLLNTVGKTLVLVLSGVYTTPNGATPLVTINIKINGNLILSIASTASNTNGITNAQWSLNPSFITAVAGASGTIEAHSTMAINLGTATTGALSVFGDGNTAPTPGGGFNLANGNSLQVTGQFSVASASNILTQRQLAMFAMN